MNYTVQDYMRFCNVEWGELALAVGSDLYQLKRELEDDLSGDRQQELLHAINKIVERRNKR